MIKRVVDVGFWTDSKVIDLFTTEDKLFMLYLLTNPHSAQLGIYKLHEKQIAFDIGYSVDEVQRLLIRFEKEFKIIRYSYETREIAILNFLKHSIIKGGRPVYDLLTREIKNVKNKDLITYTFDNIRREDYLNQTVKKLIDEYFEKIENSINTDIQNVNEKQNDNEVSLHNESLHDESLHNESLDDETVSNESDKPLNKTTNKKATKKNKQQEEQQEIDSLFKSISLENDELHTTLWEFYNMRKDIKKTMSKRAVELFIKKLSDMTSEQSEQIEILQNSIINSWQGIFPLKDNQGKKKEESKKLERIKGATYI